MFNNVLYRVINELVLKKAVLPSWFNVLKESNNSKDYILLSLPKNKQVVDDNYLLTEHHLSVYKESASEIDKKCQYHYTAFFTDKAGKKYKLHVYYDGKDHCILKPQLKVAKSAHEFQHVPTEEYSEAFKTFANLEIKSLVKHLRDVQNEHLLALKGKYNALEQQAKDLSNDLVVNKTTYLAIIEEQLLLSEEQKKYTNNIWEVIPQILELKKRRNALASSATTVSYDSEDIEYTEKSNHDLKESEPKDFKTKINEKTDSDKIDVVKSIRKLKKNVSTFNSTNQADPATFIAECYRDLLLLEIEGGSTKVLDDLKQDIEEKGKNLLEFFLRSMKYTDAAKLQCFYPLVSESVLNAGIALSVVNTDLLGFLLKENILHGDYKNFSIKGKTYSSLIAYYFEAEIPVDKKIKGLKVLIENGVSLMTLDETGLPYAAVLLLDLKHPLRQVICDQVDSALFYKQVNDVLNVVLLKVSFTAIKKAEITQLIQDNMIHLNHIKRKSSVAKLTSLSSKVKKELLPHKTELALELKAQLTRDPGISENQKTIDAELQKCLKRLKNKINKKNKLVKIAQIDMDKFLELLVSYNENDIPSLGALKCIYIAQQQHVLQYLELEAQVNPNGIIKNGGAKNKQQDELIKQQSRLFNLIEIQYRKMLVRCHKQAVIENDLHLKEVERLRLIRDEQIKKAQPLPVVEKAAEASQAVGEKAAQAIKAAQIAKKTTEQAHQVAPEKPKILTNKMESITNALAGSASSNSNAIATATSRFFAPQGPSDKAIVVLPAIGLSNMV